MNKKGLMLKFTLIIILGLLFFFSAAFFANKLYGVTKINEPNKSFSVLKDRINSIQPDERKSLTLVMDDNSAIVGISAQGDFRHVFKSTQYIFFTMKKPDKCKDTACICRCTNVRKKEGTEPSELICDSNRCTAITQVDFLSKSTPKYESPRSTEYEFQNGFIIARDDVKGDVGTYFPDYANLISRRRGVFIERYKDIVNVCEKSPCFTAAEKQIAEQQQKPEESS